MHGFHLMLLHPPCVTGFLSFGVYDSVASQEAQKRLDELRNAETQEYAVGGDADEAVEPPLVEPAHEAEQPAEKPKKVRRKPSKAKLTKVVLGGEEEPLGTSKAKPCLAKPKKVEQAALLALPAPPPAPATINKTRSDLSNGYDPPVEDAQDPKAFEKARSPDLPQPVPPAANDPAISPPRPTKLLPKFSAAAAGKVHEKGKPKKPLGIASDESDDDMPSPGTLRANLEKYLRAHKDTWHAC